MKKRKFKLVIVMLCLVSIVLCACGNSSKSVDEQFITALTKGLEARWALTSASDDNVTKEDWEKYFDAEYKKIISFQDKSFENPDLEKWAKEYINSIVASKEALSYFGSDQWTAKYSNGAYNTRCRALFKINKLVPLNFSEKYASEAAPILSRGEVIDMAKTIMDSVTFKKVSTKSSWVPYEAIVENTSSVSFSYFSIDVDLIDKSGVTVDTVSAYTDNWKPGEKSRFEFSTDATFSSMEIAGCNWNY